MSVKHLFSWECSVLADDGTGEAKIFFDGDIVLELLNICKKTQSMVEDAAIRKNTCFEYSNAREITESMTNSQRLNVDTVHEKDFGSNSVASLSLCIPQLGSNFLYGAGGSSFLQSQATVDTIDDYSQYICQ